MFLSFCECKYKPKSEYCKGFRENIPDFFVKIVFRALLCHPEPVCNPLEYSITDVSDSWAKAGFTFYLLFVPEILGARYTPCIPISVNPAFG